MVVAALAVVSASGYLAVNPALADSCDPKADSSCMSEFFDWYDDEVLPEPENADAPITDLPGDTDLAEEPPPADSGEFEAAMTHLAHDTKQAIRLAKGLLENISACDQQVTGKGSKFTADQILYTLVVNKRIEEHFSENPVHRSGNLMNASVDKVGIGSNGLMKLYSPWAAAVFKDSWGRLGDTEWRALTLLHEVGHLTGSLSANESDAPPWEADTVRECNDMKLP
ncbi:hypothetical protein [Nonomuraea sp. NPDC005650]|uniref:hypothetical protein n=1 Tax=Nonomuraea sp. NPDC005650 TaxID=3157045 RepID=UPI0033B22C4B